MKLQPKRTYKIVVFVLAVIIVSASLLWLFEKPFNETEWKSNPLQRYKMVDNLIESQLLIDKSKNEVVVLLGEPYSKSNIEKDIFIYKIGDEPSFFKSRKEHLLIIFINQKVDEVTLALE